MADTTVEMTLLSEADIIAAGATDMAACVDTMEETFRLISAGDYRLAGHRQASHGSFITFPEHPIFPDMPVDGPDRRFIAMPGYLGGRYHMAGCKWYGSNAENRAKGLPRSILMLMLNDPDTGAPLALMSANLISSYRTAAVPALAVRKLARADCRTVGIIGPGVMNKTTLRSFITERPMIEKVKVKGRGKRSLDAYVAYVRDNFPGVKVEVVQSEEDAIRGADLVSICTPENGKAFFPYISRAWVKPGAVICCPSDVDTDRDPFRDGSWKMVADLFGMYEDWRDEFGRHGDGTGTLANIWVDMVDDGDIDRASVLELGDIVAGKAPVRDSEDDIIFFSIGGIPLEDISWGTTIYRQAIEAGIGQRFKVWDAPALA